MRISDWSSDVCSSDLIPAPPCCHPHHITTERETMLDWIADPNIWASLLTLTFLEIVLGIDNIIFLSIITDRVAENRRVLAQRLGLGLALVGRIVLLAGLVWLSKLTEPLFDMFGQEVSWRSEEHTSELQSLMRITYAVFCL